MYNNQSTSKYFRITAYHPQENISVIMDSNGMFDKLWQFSAYMIEKGFNIIEVANSDNFLDCNIYKADYDSEHIILRANHIGKPIELTHNLNGVNYQAIQVEDKIYIPDKTITV